MITLTVSLKPNGSNTEVIAQIISLLAGLEDSMANVESNEEKPKKTRKVRVYTDEEKAAFRARMVAAREAKAKVNEDEEVDAKAEEDLEKAIATFETKPVSMTASKMVSTMPRTGRKVSARQSAQ